MSAAGKGEGYIKNLVVFDRRLGCTDESATDEEQAEKILYYYPEQTSLYMQLSKMTMIESLIEFSAKFSEDPIDVVLMEGVQWGFYQCEPDVWIVIAVDTQITSIEQGGSIFYYKHSPNGEGLVQALEKMYFMYCSMFGSVGVMLRHAHHFSSTHPEHHSKGDEDSVGWQRIRQVAALRKVVRKLRQKCRQVDQDIEVMKGYEEAAAFKEQAQQNKQNAMDNEDSIETDTEPQRVMESTQDQEKQDQNEEGKEEFPQQHEEEQEPKGEEIEHLGIRSGTSTLVELTAARDAIQADILAKEDELEAVIGPVPEVGGYIPIRTCTYTPLLVRYVVSVFSDWYLSSGEFLSPSGLSGMWGMHFSAVGNPSYYAVERLRAAVRATMTTISPSLPAICLQLPSSEESSSWSESAGSISGGEGSCVGGANSSDKNAPSTPITSTGATTAGADAGSGSNSESPVTAKCLILYEGQVIWNDFFDHDIMHFYEFIRLQQNNSLREAVQFLQNASSVSSTDDSNASMNKNTSTHRSSMPNIRAGGGDDEKTNAMRKLQTFSRRFSVNRRGSSKSTSAVKIQQKNSQEVIASYSAAYRNRKGFFSQGWNIVDLMSPSAASAINQGGRAGKSLMGYLSETCRRALSDTGSGSGVSAQGSTSVWCPRIFSPIQRAAASSPVLDTETVKGKRKAKEDAEYDGGLEELQPEGEGEENVLEESEQCLCLGRAVVYQQASYIVVVVLPDWTSAEEFHRNLSQKSTHSDSSEKQQLIDVFSFCTLLQMNLSSAITSNLEESISAQHLPSPVPGPSFEMPDGVSFVCCNNLNVAFKAVNVYRSASPPTLAWPHPLSPGGETLLQGLQLAPQSFPLSSGQLIGSFQPSVVAAINDVRASISQGYKSPMGEVQEACVRVTSAFRGGVWVMGRSLGERHIVFILEGCSTINEVHGVVNRVMTNFLGNILL